MPTVKGRSDVQRYMASAPRALADNLLPGAGRAGGKVIAADAKQRSVSQEVADAIVVRVKRADGRVVVRITVPPGWARSLGIWQEWGTSAHFIRVDDEQRGGKTAGRINRLDKAAAEGSREGPGHALRIGGNFVTGTVRHPGAEKHPFLRPALDHNEREAIAAAQNYINSRVARMRKSGLIVDEDAEE